MTNFETSEDIPLVLRGGDSLQIAQFNRIAALNRINYLVRKELPEFDIRLKSEVFLKCLDLEVYKKYYIDKPKDTKIDEEFCQNMAKTCIEMEKEESYPVNEEEFNNLLNDATTQTSEIPKEKKTGIIAMVKELFK